MKEVDIEGVKIQFKNMTHFQMVNHSQKSRTSYLNKMINLL